MNHFKLYCISPRHLSGIQKGIQSLHGAMHYVKNFNQDEEFQRWLNEDETVIILQVNSVLELSSIKDKLKEENVKYSEFFEPDLNGLQTSLCFICSEERFDKLSYGLTKFVKSLALATN